MSERDSGGDGGTAAVATTGLPMRWLRENVLVIATEFRLAYLPPLMVYVASGISGLTAIVGTFFVKEYLGLSAAFLAALGFWAGIPWALKMPLGHLVDLIWPRKSVLIYLGAALIAVSLLVMIGLLSDPATMRTMMPASAWYVLSALLAPVGYVVQDVVADAMTVEAVPRVDEHGQPYPPAVRKSMNTTMQTLGRVAVVGGSVAVAVVNIWAFEGVGHLDTAQKAAIYTHIYELALLIPLCSVSGVILAAVLQRREARRLRRLGLDPRLHGSAHAFERIAPNWWILGGGGVFVMVTVTLGLAEIPFAQEFIFAFSLTIVSFLMWRLVRELEPAARRTLLGTSIVIFVYRAMPGPGAGATWWMIDVLRFNQQFLSELSLIGSVFALFGMFIFRRFMAERSIAYVVGFLTLMGTVLGLPILGMYYGLADWTAAHTGGVVNAHFIALIDTAAESPLGQVAMIPMLAWIAGSAPERLKATYFAVMASFANLALSASQLGTKYLNQIYVVTRQVRDHLTGAVTVPANYSTLGDLLIATTVIGLLVPLAAIALVRLTRLGSE